MTEVLSNGHANGARVEQSYGDDRPTPQLTPVRLPMVDESTATDYNSMNGEFVSPRQARSPRFEAFVMTGDKMINLKSKISPCYAKVYQDQLPPSTEVDDCYGMPKRRGPFDDFPSLHHKMPPSKLRRFHQESAVPTSQSEHFLNGNKDSMDKENERDEDAHRAVDEGRPDSRMQHSNHNYSASTLPDNTVNGTASPSRQLPNGECRNAPSYISSKFTTSQSTPASPAKRPEYSSSLRHNNAAIDRRVSAQKFGSLGPARSNDSITNADQILRIATRLFALDGFKRVDAASFLMLNDDFSQKVTTEFLRLFNFSGVRIDAALTDFLNHVGLTGESSDRARVLMQFSSRYHECNPSLFHNADEIHALTCALILLNTDLHGPNAGKKMTSREFVNNLAHTDYEYDRNLLKTLYKSVKDTPFVYHDDGLNGSHPDTPKRSSSARVSRRKSTKNSLLINPNEQIDYHHGWVLKKSVYDSDGKRTPLGRRKWQMFYATVRGMVLYLHKNDRGFESSQYETFHNCVMLHHAIAEVPKDYTKRQNVFRLRTANFGELLFQAAEKLEMAKWISAINYVAAAFSTPSLPSPVSSGSVAFHRPLLPSAPTVLPIPEQLKAHQDKLDEMTNKLSRLREDAPSMKSKGKPVYEYFYRERYLDKERERYELYVSILSDKLATLSQNGTVLPSDRCSVGTASLSKNYSTRVNRHNLNMTRQSDDTVPNGHNNYTSSGDLASNRHFAGKRSVDDITEYDEATDATQGHTSSSRQNSPKKSSRQQ